MQFKTLALVATATLAAARNTVTFVSQDELHRTIYFTGNPESAQIAPVRVEGDHNRTVEIPTGWIGNFYAVTDGYPDVPGMLGEFAFNSWGGLTFFDVSAIVNPDDLVGVKKIWPVSQSEPFSGCDRFPCAFAYYEPQDIQTKASHETDFFCTLGNPDYIPWAAKQPWQVKAKREAAPSEGDDASHAKFTREFIEGKYKD
jgi:hypothetical protein